MKLAAITFSLLTLVGAASAQEQAEVGVFSVPICDTADFLSFTLRDAGNVAEATKVIDGLRAEGKACAKPGNLAGEWILDGTRRAYLVGILNVGAEPTQALQVWGPPYRLIRLAHVTTSTTTPSSSN